MTVSKARILALLQPLIAVGSGALAAWLLVHVHLLGIFHVTRSQVAELIASAVVFVVTTALTWLAAHQHLIPITSAIRLGARSPVVPFTPRQIVTFLTPYISVAAGAGVAWLFVHVHFLGFLHVTQQSVVQTVASGVVFALTSVLTWLSTQYHILPTLFPPPRRTVVRHHA